MLAVRSTYGPWIMASRQNTDLGRTIGAETDHRHLHQFIALRDAGGELSSQPGRLPAGSFIHLEPRSSAHVIVPERSRFAHVAFCATYHPLESGEYPNEAWLDPASMTHQASSSELWGRPFPTCFPKAIAGQAAPELLQIAGIWWRSPVDRLEANARLGLLLSTVIRHLMASSSQHAVGEDFLTPPPVSLTASSTARSRSLNWPTAWAWPPRPFQHNSVSTAAPTGVAGSPLYACNGPCACWNMEPACTWLQPTAATAAPPPSAAPSMNTSAQHRGIGAQLDWTQLVVCLQQSGTYPQPRNSVFKAG
jgi:hypothetical protein